MTSRNSMYEQNMRDKGLKKVTLWIPDESADDLKLMAAICCENRDFNTVDVKKFKNRQNERY